MSAFVHYTPSSTPSQKVAPYYVVFRPLLRCFPTPMFEPCASNIICKNGVALSTVQLFQDIRQDVDMSGARREYLPIRL